MAKDRKDQRNNDGMRPSEELPPCAEQEWPAHPVGDAPKPGRGELEREFPGGDPEDQDGGSGVREFGRTFDAVAGARTAPRMPPDLPLRPGEIGPPRGSAQTRTRSRRLPPR
jgi:hypothetical protein